MVRNVLGYTLGRLLLFAAAFAVVYMFGARSWLALVLALVVSAPISYVLLTRQREAMSASISTGITRLRGAGRRLDEGAIREDREDRGA